MLVSHGKITEAQAYEIEISDDSGLRHKSMFQIMSIHEGHRDTVGFT